MPPSPKVPRSCIEPFEYRKACCTQLHTLLIWELPTTWPLLLIPWAPLQQPPNVPKYSIEPLEYTKPRPALALDRPPTTWPLLLIPEAELELSPRVPRSCIKPF